jgi:thioesterase domain-containing protein
MAGYSWGSMLAFEVAKKMEADGEQVGFLGAFNLPPHIKWRMRQFDWVECLVHLAYFSDLISEESTTTVAPYMRTLPSKSAQMDYLLEISSPERLEELALSKANLSNWADVAFALQSRAVDYDPSGKVTAMDVFYCRPLTILGITKQQWLDQHLRAWEEFVGDVQYHEVDGAHYTMLLPEHVGSFQRHLNKVLKKRGV